MSTLTRTARAHIQFEDGYRFEVTYPDVPAAPAIRIDEAPPLGTGTGPTPAGLLAAAVGGCLAASLRFCLAKARVDPDAINVDVEAHMAPNERGRLRITGLDVHLAPCLPSVDLARLERCTGLFEEFCIVTESVRAGIPVHVAVEACGTHQARTA
jgi:uncharacterized OsmC-like protein